MEPAWTLLRLATAHSLPTRMHETTRKRICRRLFVAFCLVPTLLVIGAIGYYHRPWRTADLARDLSGRLHAAVAIGQSWQPRSGVTEHRSIELRDLRTGLPLLACDRARAERRSASRMFQLGQVRLPGTEWASLVPLLEIWLGTPGLTEIHVRADEVVFLQDRVASLLAKGSPGRDATWTLENLQLHGEPDTGSQGRPAYQLRAQADYRAKGRVVPLRLIVHRGTGPSGPRWQVTLDLSRGEFPVGMLQGMVPGGIGFQEARFRGVIQLESDLQSTRGTLRGRLAGWDLQQLLPGGSRHRCSGEAAIDWDLLRWQDGRVREAVGLLRAAHGMASQSLLVDAVKLLYCQAAVDLGKEPSSAFDVLACRFQLRATGLTVWGECALRTSGDAKQDRAGKDRMSGCLLSRRGMPLLWQSKYIVPVAQMVRMATSSPDGWTLPATREAQRLAQRLPLPDAPDVTKKERGRKE